MSWKPEGYTSVSPYLIVGDAGRALAFIETVFDGTRLRVMPREDGGTMHAEIRVGDSVVMLGEMPRTSSDDAPGADINVHVYVPDATATFERARAAGGTVVQEPGRQGDGDLRGGISDGHGTTWWISTQG